MKKNRISGIYCFENILDGKRYVGKSIDLHRRISDHLNDLKRNSDKSILLQRAWNKYGQENFKIFIIEECEEELLDKTEIFYIKEWNTKTPKGYNLTDGGEGSSGYIHTEESKRKIGDSQRGEKNAWFGKLLPEYIREKMIKNHADFSGENHPFWGKHHTEESKNKISENYPDTNLENNSRFGKKNNNASSKYFGVSYHKRSGFWVARITRFGKKINIGQSKQEVEAAKIYDDYIVKNNFPNPLNFPENYI